MQTTAVIVDRHSGRSAATVAFRDEMENKVLGGPSSDTLAGDIVTVILAPDGKHGVIFVPDNDGCAAVVDSFERLDNGKFGPVQKHAGVHYGDVLFEFNDTSLLNTKFNDVLKLISDKSVLKKELKFMNSREYYRRKLVLSIAFSLFFA